MRRVFNIVEEPRGELLRQLIYSLSQYASAVLVVVRDDLGLDETGQALLSRLQPELLRRERRSSWPGTMLLDEEATVLQFAVSQRVLDEVLTASGGLFGWQQPELPEDLALMRADGTAVLASICHGRDAYLEICDEEYQHLVATVFEIKRMICLQQQV
jgi:hypothetical protein